MYLLRDQQYSTETHVDTKRASILIEKQVFQIDRSSYLSFQRGYVKRQHTSVNTPSETADHGILPWLSTQVVLASCHCQCNPCNGRNRRCCTAWVPPLVTQYNDVPHHRKQARPSMLVAGWCRETIVPKRKPRQKEVRKAQV